MHPDLIFDLWETSMKHLDTDDARAAAAAFAKAYDVPENSEPARLFTAFYCGLYQGITLGTKLAEGR